MYTLTWDTIDTMRYTQHFMNTYNQEIMINRNCADNYWCHRCSLRGFATCSPIIHVTKKLLTHKLLRFNYPEEKGPDNSTIDLSIEVSLHKSAELNMRTSPESHIVIESEISGQKFHKNNAHNKQQYNPWNTPNKLHNFQRISQHRWNIVDETSHYNKWDSGL